MVGPVIRDFLKSSKRKEIKITLILILKSMYNTLILKSEITLILITLLISSNTLIVTIIYRNIKVYIYVFLFMSSSSY